MTASDKRDEKNLTATYVTRTGRTIFNNHQPLEGIKMRQQKSNSLTFKLTRALKAALILPLILYSLLEIANINNEQQHSVATNNQFYLNENSINHQFATRSLNSKSGSYQQQQQQSSSSILQNNDIKPKSSLLFSPQSDDGQTKQGFIDSFFGIKILRANALSQHSLYQTQQDKGIILLNSTNFNQELIQNKHPFPHIKLIEYYVSFCGFCAKFKKTYLELTKEIHPWRNVIRPSAIDLGVSSNSPIAHSWSVETVPTLRIHPPPKPSLASKLDKQLSSWQQTLSLSDLQKSMFNEYNSSGLMLHSLNGVTQYMDNVSLLKLDLLRYIERYVAAAAASSSGSSEALPETWPNLRPVKENSLIELLRNHPRQELFLIIEGGPGSSTSGSDQSSSGPATTTTNAAVEEPSVGLQIMMELSSAAPYKAVRYVRASENKALIEDVIVQHKRAKSDQLTEQQIVEQMELLNNLLKFSTAASSHQETSNTILIVHIDDSHSPVKSASSSSSSTESGGESASGSSVIQFMTIVSAIDVGQYDQPLLESSSHLPSRGSYVIGNAASRAKRSLFSVSGSAMLDKMTTNRKVELLSLYIKQTYTETVEDRKFVKMLNAFDEITNSALLPATGTNEIDSTLNPALIDKQTSLMLLNNNNNNKQQSNSDPIVSEDQLSVYDKLTAWFNPESLNGKVITASHHQFDCLQDYGDKLKAIRYMLFNEIPRATATLDQNSPTEQQEKINILVNLISVIKAYFPFPDSASIQFIDGVQSYLKKQQSKLSTSLSATGGGGEIKEKVSGFKSNAFKQELKRLEAEEKRLPEIKEWKHCTGYPCAVWRLFHTLTAFEYKKLSQIRQPLSTGFLQQLQPQLLDNNGSSQTTSIKPPPPAMLAQSAQQATTIETITTIANSSSTIDSSSSGSSQQPVERLVSPPSTTTSLSLTIATPTSSSSQQQGSTLLEQNNKQLTEADLPMPVILVMRDYITNFFSCEECKKRFKSEAADLSFDRVRQQEPAEFSVLWLWETHNRVNKRLSVEPDTNPQDRPKIWFPSYYQCSSCYKKPPTFLQDLTTASSLISSMDSISKSATDPTIFHESIEWNKQEVLSYLLDEYTKQPMDNYTKIFGYQVPYGFGYLVITCICCFFITTVLRCASCYIERQKRHKATLLNGNGAHYSVELQ